jgi:hypothetical protein
VRRDEADAQAREEEEDRRTQIIDSERRLKLLRGHQIEELPGDDESPLTLSRKSDHGHGRKRRKLAGEDDTDRDMRLAREEAALNTRTSITLQNTNKPITDSQGHIDLFPSKSQSKEKNAEAEAECAKKKRELEDQYTMRFSNAAGFKQGLSDPWYSAINKNDTEIPGKDVWGNEDVGRKHREKTRADANDPLSAMRKGVKQLRDVEKSRKDWMAERGRELRELEALDESRCSERRRKKRRRYRNDSGSLDDFSLDSSSKDHKKQDRHHRPRSQAHHGDTRSGR